MSQVSRPQPEAGAAAFANNGPVRPNSNEGLRTAPTTLEIRYDDSGRAKSAKRSMPILRLRSLRLRLSTVLCLVVVAALVMAYWAHQRQNNVPWHRHGGMIGWTQASIVSWVGEPGAYVRDDVAHAERAPIRPSPPAGPFRTLVFQTFDGTFVAWFTAAPTELIPVFDPPGSKRVITTDTFRSPLTSNTASDSPGVRRSIAI